MIRGSTPVAWVRSPDGLGWEVKPESPLPVELGLFRHPEFASQRRLPGGPVGLLVTWLYPDLGVALVDCPVSFDPVAGRLVLSTADRNALRERWRSLAPGCPSAPLPTRGAGIWDSLTLPVMATQLVESLAAAGTPPGLGYFPRANAFAPTGRVVELADDELLPREIGFHSTAYPELMTLKLEPTSRCNFRCEFCVGRYIAQGDIDTRLAVSLLDQFEGLRAVELTGEGEPLLYRELCRVIAECKRRGLAVHITTNGSLLHGETAKRVFGSGIDSIAFSLESTDPKQFAAIRPGGQLDRVVEAIQAAVSWRETRFPALEVRLWVSILRQTLVGLHDVVRFGRDLGVDRIEFQPLNPHPGYVKYYPLHLQADVPNRSEIEALFADPNQPPELRAALTPVLAGYQAQSCDVFQSQAMVNFRGEVTPCCLLKVPDYQPLGNLSVQTFREVWESDQFRFFRFALQHGVVLRPCVGCPAVGGRRIEVS